MSRTPVERLLLPSLPAGEMLAPSRGTMPGVAPGLQPRDRRWRMSAKAGDRIVVESAAVAHRVDRHPDRRDQAVVREPGPPEDEAVARGRIDDIPPHTPPRPHQDRTRPDRKAALDPFREPSS